MANVELNIGVSAEYDLLLQKCLTDANGEVILDDAGNPVPVGAPRLVHSQKNLITNAGMDRLGVADYMTSADSRGFGIYCRVGGGSTEPAFTDTALASQIAAVQRQAGVLEWGTGAYLNSVIMSFVFTFGVGAAAGNLNEIGLGGSASDNLQTRSLFKDAGGSTVTIVVASDEQLIVNYRIIFRPDTADKVFNPPPTSPTPTSYTLTLRPANLGKGSPTASGRLGAGTSQIGQDVYYGPTSGVGPITGVPAGTRATNNVTVTIGSYTPGSFQRTDKYKINTTGANFADIGAIMFNGSVPFDWQLGISPRLTKVAPETIDITILNKWSRA